MTTTYRNEYHREEDRDKQGGWKSWFGLGDKDEDRDRGYNYTKTTTYRDTQPTTYRETQPSYGYSGDRYPERTGYTTGNISGGYTTGARGGYGYTTSDEANRGQSWNVDRDYTTRGGYGVGGDRDYTYRQETRTYGGDRDREYPSRSYGITTDPRPTSRGVYPTCGPHGYSSEQCRYTGDYTSRYPTVGDRDYTTTSRYQTGDRDYTTSRYQTGGDRDYTTSHYPVTGGTYGGDYGRTYGGDYTTSRYGYSGDRDTGRYTGETRGNIGYGYGGDRDYTRSYQQTTRY